MDCKSDVLVIERKVKYGVVFLQSLLYDAALAVGWQKPRRRWYCAVTGDGVSLFASE